MPIADELAPFLKSAIDASPSELVFPAGDGAMRSREVDLEKILRRAMKRAGIVTGYRYVCRVRKAPRCDHVETAPTQVEKRCPKHGDRLWPSAQVRPIRFHDLRHSTASLLMMGGANLAAVQRIMRHEDPKTTTQIYGHLAPGYLSAEANRLRFGLEADDLELEPAAEPAKAAAGGVLDTLLGQRPGGKKKAGTQGDQATGFRPSRVERETGFEPATLSLGS